jgi:Alternative oxidase
MNRFVGYLEEEAVITYTDIISLLDSGKLPMWKALPAPAMAVEYYRLGPQATVRYISTHLQKAL